MKTLAILCNVVLFCFTCLVLVTDGLATQAIYIIFSLLLLLIPIFTVVAIVLSARRTALGPVAIICNIVLLAFSCWAFVDRYPHPEEDGFIAYVLLLALTPILSVALFLRNRQHSRRLPAGA